MSNISELALDAKAVLDKNWLGTYTRPSPRLYPHQWNWDSGFIAIGYSTYDQDRAQLELTSLFKAQWKNGMVPHIVFNQKVPDDYFPGAKFWDSQRSENTPEDYITSGITQPPIHASSALCIYERASDKEKALKFLEHIYPKLLASHRFFYNERDPKNEGLVYIRHPWESGLDNSPNWDNSLKKITPQDLPEFKRKDLKKGVPSEQRPTDDDYNRYIYLLELFKKHDYNESDILEECPFLIQDTLMNSVLAKADHDLAKIGKILGENVSEIISWEEKTKNAINRKLWHKGHGIYDDFDLKADKMIEVDTATGFSPLFSGAPSQNQAQKLYDYLDSKSFCKLHDNKCFSIPNYNMEGEYFEPLNYWRGPIWININWMLHLGLLRYGFKDKAESVKADIIELIRRFGFHEYFDPIKGIGYGSSNFSWTAALFLDVVYEEISNTSDKHRQNLIFGE